MHRLRPRVVRRARRDHHRRRQSVAGEEAGHAQALDPLRGQALPQRRGVGMAREPGLDRRLQLRDPRPWQVDEAPRIERLPAAAHMEEIGEGGLRCQRRRRGQWMEPCRAMQPQRLVVGAGAAAGEVSVGRRRAPWIGGVAQHARELLPDLDFQLDRDGCHLGADVVGVVERGHQLREQARQQQVRGHVAEIARREQRHGALEARRQLAQRLFHPRVGRQARRRELRGGFDHRRILGMEIAAPVDVVAQECDQQALERGLVLGRGAEEPGREEIG